MTFQHIGTTPSPGPRLTPASVCPECECGKHVNCDGTAWDDEHDCIGRCECARCDA